ncbi:radial spoke head 1 homolog [Dysidea avara]|uniref:radial spoke head 1 homolog n=1 Tax=Dysidea avara TaxID=196820 RepID=UPI00331DED85
MDGYGVAKYINGDEYHGDWMDGLRHGYGHLTETNVSGNRYYGDWSNDQCHGYSVYDDKSRHHRYLGMFQYNCYHIWQWNYCNQHGYLL